MLGSYVLTTINDPILLQGYFENFEHFQRLDDVEVIVIPDLKTPESAFKRCEELKRSGLKISCPTIDEQNAFLKRLGVRPSFIPFNSDNRRNIGYLMSLEHGADFVVSIDDDNYCTDGADSFGEHSIVLKDMVKSNVVHDESGDWFNICSMLEFDLGKSTYPRGFPYFARHKDGPTKVEEGAVSIHMNAGLWLGDPDVDGITWLVNPMKGRSFKGSSFVLGKHAWSPINSQNTSMRRSVVPSYYFVKMGYPMAGTSIDRYGDIFSGYFAQACVRHMNAAIRVGTPLTDHRRNSHNYMNDASNEWGCILVLEELLSWLPSLKLDGSNYCDQYLHLAESLQDRVEESTGGIWTPAVKAYFHQVAYHMKEWVSACRVIGI